MACMCVTGASSDTRTRCLHAPLAQAVLASLRPGAHDAAAQLALRRAAAAHHAAAAQLAGPGFARRPDLCEAACRLLAAAAAGGGGLAVGAACALMLAPLAAAAEALNGGRRRDTAFQVGRGRVRSLGRLPCPDSCPCPNMHRAPLHTCLPLAPPQVAFNAMLLDCLTSTGHWDAALAHAAGLRRAAPGLLAARPLAARLAACLGRAGGARAAPEMARLQGDLVLPEVKVGGGCLACE
jgi:hypothetical protein